MPPNAKGGLGIMHPPFGEQIKKLIEELNRGLVA